MGYISEDQKHSVANLYAHFMNGKIQFKVYFSANKWYFLQKIQTKTFKNINLRKEVYLTLKKLGLHGMCKKVVP
jgi:adenylate cyclase class IV